MTDPKVPTQAPGRGLRPIEGRDLDALASTDDGESISEAGGSLDEAAATEGHDRVRRAAGRLSTRVAWLLLVVGLALGSTGAAAAMQPPPDGTNREELTWAADQALIARLDDSVREVVLLRDDVERLGTMTRQTLSSLAQVNAVALAAAWSGGADALNSIETRSASLSKSLECAPWDEARDVELSKLYQADLVDEWHGLCTAVASVAPLPNAWNALVSGSRTAMQVATDVNTHDAVGADALQLATSGRYTDALAKLAEAETSIADATAIAADLAKAADVSTLQDWLTRTAAMDSALRTLWQEMVASKGRLNEKVTAALKGVNEAKAMLPDNAAVLQVVLYEMAGRLTVNGIVIETTRGQLSAAIDAVTGGTVEGE